jgi:hypothetical protein
MNTTQKTIAIVGFILLALMATNPSIEDHREGVKEMYKKKLGEMNNDKKDDLATQIGTGIATLIGDGFIDKIVSRDNYLLFSLTKVSVGDKTNNIGFGILGQIFVKDYDKIKNKFENNAPRNIEARNWTGKYTYDDADLVVENDGSCIIEEVGFQVYYKILCYSKVNDNKLEIYFDKTLEGNYLPEQWINKAKPILTLFYRDNLLYTDEGQRDIEKNGARILIKKIE